MNDPWQALTGLTIRPQQAHDTDTMDPQSTVTSILAGELLPNVFAIVSQFGLNLQPHRLATFATCLVAGRVVTALTGG